MHVPPELSVHEFASCFDEPRTLRVAPDGDIFLFVGCGPPAVTPRPGQISGLTRRAGSGHNTATDLVFPRDILMRRFSFGAAMHILMKDIELAIEQGEDLGVPVRLCETARLVFKRAIFAGSKDDDLGNMAKYVEQGAGFEIPRAR